MKAPLFPDAQYSKKENRMERNSFHSLCMAHQAVVPLKNERVCPNKGNWKLTQGCRTRKSMYMLSVIPHPTLPIANSSRRGCVSKLAYDTSGEHIFISKTFFSTNDF